MTENNDHPLDARLVALERLWFVADTPLFLDGDLVERFYDAVFRPEVELASKSETLANEFSAKIAGGAKVSAEVSPKMPPFLSLFGLDVLNAKASAEASVSGEGNTKRTKTGAVNYVAVKSTERRLEKLISLYAEKYGRRLFWIDASLKSGHNMKDVGMRLSWGQMANELDKPGPRPIVILDLEPGSKLMPMYGELMNGKGCELIKDYLSERARKDENEYPIPKYPSSKLPLDEQSHLRRQYWEKVNERFESGDVLRVIETAAGDERARFDWIDFRAMIDLVQSEEMIEPPHLHFMARGAYPTGNFAYQLVRRGHRHGLRLIGTLKKGQDINILAAYER